MVDLRIGSVSFVNALPLTRGLEGVVVEVPSRLAERFHRGELDVAMIPVVTAGDRPIVPGMAIASRGPVDSVALFLKKPLAEVRRVLLDTSSRTSAALTRILLEKRFGLRPEYVPCGPGEEPAEADGDALLLIGDPALAASRVGVEVLDLATAWREWTGLPFVFAAWVARTPEVAEVARPILAAAKERGLAERNQIAREAAERTGLPEPLLRTYLTERITYDLGPEERAGMERFLGLLQDGGPKQE